MVEYLLSEEIDARSKDLCEHCSASFDASTTHLCPQTPLDSHGARVFFWKHHERISQAAGSLANFQIATLGDLRRVPLSIWSNHPVAYPIGPARKELIIKAAHHTNLAHPFYKSASDRLAFVNVHLEIPNEGDAEDTLFAPLWMVMNFQIPMDQLQYMREKQSSEWVYRQNRELPFLMAYDYETKLARFEMVHPLTFYAISTEDYESTLRGRCAVACAWLDTAPYRSSQSI